MSNTNLQSECPAKDTLELLLDGTLDDVAFSNASKSIARTKPDAR